MRTIPSLLMLLAIGCGPIKVGDDGTSSDGGSGVPDADGDGYIAEDQGGADCDDDDASIHPGAEDAWYDGIDSDCDGESDYDADGDSHDSSYWGGDDCNDDDAGIHPGATDAAYDGIDSDCGGDSDYDADGDGSDAEAWGGDDCNDSDPTIYPGAPETWYDGVDDNCDGLGDNDADGDGYDADFEGGEDCMDDDPDAYPGAYDYPNDGLDQDCDGSDREIDGAVVPFGKSVDTDVVYAVAGLGGMDVAVLMDTTCSMGSALSYFSFDDLDDGLVGIVDDVRYGYATFDDYNYGSYGSSSDKPFILRHQVTDDLAAVQDEFDSTSLHSGGDGPEGSMEALYQALTGAGYDQGCDEEYDSSDDVLPFVSDSADPFLGLEGDSYDSTVTGGGTLGGLGFRSTSLPVVVYVTDNYMRDPDAGYGSPGGCPIDAGATDVAAAAADLGAFLVGVAYNGTTATSQMEDLADATDSLIDTDGDGVGDDPAVYSASAYNITDAVIEALADVADSVTLAAVYEECVVEVTEDPYGMVSAVDPESFTEVDTTTTEELTFTVTLEGTTYSTSPLTGTIELALVCDGTTVTTTSFTVEIPPG